MLGDCQIGGAIEDLIVGLPILGIVCLQRIARLHLDIQEVVDLLRCSSIGLELGDKGLR